MYFFFLYPYFWAFCYYYCVWNDIGHHEEESFSFTRKADEEEGSITEKKQGATWILRCVAMQYLMPRYKKFINGRIEGAILDAVDKKVEVVGLGNFNKAEWINHGGTDIVNKLKDQLKDTVISHGDTLSAAVIFQYAKQLKEQNYWRKSVFVTGSTSKIGRAVVLSLAKMGVKVYMYTQVKERFEEIASEAGEFRDNLICTSNLKDGKCCDLWLTGKMLPRGKELLNAIPQDITVVNFSVPDPLTPALLKSRPDILHLDTGLLAYDLNAMNPHFTWLLPRGQIYACLGGAIVHSMLGIKKHEVGAVVVEDMQMYWDAALQLGFTIPSPSSFYTPIKMPPPRVA